MKIMIVDDCQTTRKLLGIYLKSKGFEMVFAENGLDALEKLATNAVNMIITDLNMPYMDGIELVKSLRADPHWQDVPILMVTTEADPEERERAFAAGTNRYLVKPVTADMVTQNIKEILKSLFEKGGASHA
ncbi:MAG TPA: response regulator [Thermodesulfovibrionales bacterium]|jgi:two-component system chemotaxis response regulator CheY|nr:response regulator [Thermodesulfovibrionales bacterium]